MNFGKKMWMMTMIRYASMASAIMVVAFPACAVVYDDAAVSREFMRTTGYFCGEGDPVGSSLKANLPD